MLLIRFLIALTLFSMYVVADQKDEGLKVGDQVPPFVLKDADDHEHNIDEIIKKENKKLVVLIIGDRTTCENGNKWGRELHKIYEKQKDILMLMIADLRDLPFFATEGMVKWGVKRENLPIKILLDWDGKVSEAYKTTRKQSNIFVINKQRKLLYYCQGKYSDDKLKELKEKIDAAIK